MVKAKFPEEPEKMNSIDRAILDARKYAIFRGVVIGAKLEVLKIQKAKGTDWFYKINLSGKEFFVVLNETGSYTLMFPEDY